MSRRRRRPPGPNRPRDLWGSVYPTLDLHGRTAEEAEREAHRWIAGRRAEGESIVRIVTGRGLHSVGPPILPTLIEELLDRLRDTVVRSYELEAGGGAYRIRLATPLSSVAPAAPAEVEAEPEVLREAVEALADLGIAATPALLEAEVRRIIKKRSGGAQ